jgi:hypothetical protein
MSRGLKGGAPRLLGRHDGAAGRLYNRQFRALSEEFGPFTGVMRFHAGGTAALFVTFQQATEALNDARRDRSEGKGRRPSASLITRLEKRQGLAWQSYSAALEKLQAMASSRPRTSFAETIRRQQ